MISKTSPAPALLALLPVFGLAPEVLGAPKLELRFPMDVRDTQDFGVEVIAKGVEAPDELLAFAFNLNYSSSLAVFTEFTPAAPFNDDTPYLGGPMGGSTFPGAQSSAPWIVLGMLHFTALDNGIIDILVRDDDGLPLTTGLFTALSPERYRINARAGVYCIPDSGSSLALTAMGLGAIAGFAHDKFRRGRPELPGQPGMAKLRSPGRSRDFQEVCDSRP